MSATLIEPKPRVVCQFPTTPEPISQGLLAGLMALRRQREALDAQIQAAEADIRASLEAGADVEPGTFRAFLKQTERRNVAWREVVERLKGAGYCENVLAHTKPSVSVRLIVEA